MQPTTILSILPLFLSPLASADCFTSGESWDRNLGPPAVQAACASLAGSYTKGQTRTQDLEQSNGQCYHFVLTRLTTGDQAPSREILQAECTDGMNKELFGCEHGGRSSYTDWEYTADPNAGPC